MKEIFDNAYRNTDGDFILENRKPSTLKIKKLHPDAIIPTYAYDGESVGLDLTAVNSKYDEVNDCWVYDTGIAIELKPNEIGLICPNSRNRKTDFYIPNTPGIIDPGYTGPITVNYKCRTSKILYYLLKCIISLIPKSEDLIYYFNKLYKKTTYPYCVGDVVAQLLIVPVIRKNIIEVDELSPSLRGTGAHGSTDKH